MESNTSERAGHQAYILYIEKTRCIMKEHSTQILGIMRARFASPQQAQENAMSMKDCPRLILSGTTKDIYFGIFALRDDLRELFTYLEDNPTVLEADAVEFSFIDRPIQEIELPVYLDGSREEISPCGSDCSKCSLKSRFDCPGCPATIHFMSQC
jgi:hypothetical protein